MELDEIPGIIEEFRQGAQNAKDAGFDGVEIHGANGYLLEQFLSDKTNARTDEYGGSVENRARFHLEVTRAAIEVWGADRVGIRVSPSNTFGNMDFTDRWDTFSYLVKELGKLNLAYIHLIEPRLDDDSPPEVKHQLSGENFRQFIQGETKLISAGGHTQETGNEFISSGKADLIAYGRLYISNPDLAERFAHHAELNEYDRSTFYGGTETGYTSYPALS